MIIPDVTFEDAAGALRRYAFFEAQGFRERIFPLVPDDLVGQFDRLDFEQASQRGLMGVCLAGAVGLCQDHSRELLTEPVWQSIIDKLLTVYEERES